MLDNFHAQKKRLEQFHVQLKKTFPHFSACEFYKEQIDLNTNANLNNQKIIDTKIYLKVNFLETHERYELNSSD